MWHVISKFQNCWIHCLPYLRQICQICLKMPLSMSIWHKEIVIFPSELLSYNFFDLTYRDRFGGLRRTQRDFTHTFCIKWLYIILDAGNLYHIFDEHKMWGNSGRREEVCLRVSQFKILTNIMSNRHLQLDLFAFRQTGTVRGRVADADPVPVGSGVFAWIRILFSNLAGSGSGFQISLDPDPVSAELLVQKKSAEISL